MRIALVVMLVAALGAGTAVAGTRAKAKVSMMSTAPVTVRGTSFHSRERVTVTVTASSTRTKTVTANAHGVFTATFPHFAIGHCVGYEIRAKGNHGSLATLKLTPECPPPAGSKSPR